MFCEIKGIKIHYERQGQGKPVLILHGWGASIEAVRPIMNCISALGYEAIAIDFPGFGETAEPPEAWGVPEYAAMTKDFIETIDIRGCDLICHSFGGRVTILLASADKTLFSRLVLVDAAGVKPRRGAKYYIRVYSFKALKHLARIGFIDKAFHISEKQKHAGSADYRALKTDVMRDTFKRVVNLDLTDRLCRIENETLLVWGDRDTATPLYQAKVMEANIKKAGLAVLEGAGHFSYADKYTQFAAVMKAFFA
ncbi:MAG: alpha/beta hydrolase [Clostridiales bacterium]|nr:alpha/beta hydrolase [Clostridiales bacterium]